MAPHFDERKNDVFRVMDVHSYGRRVALVEDKPSGSKGEIINTLFLNIWL
ncbi:MAG: hypothetical protein QXL89_02770 [Nitrososphaeria archaeon]